MTKDQEALLEALYPRPSAPGMLDPKHYQRERARQLIRAHEAKVKAEALEEAADKLKWTEASHIAAEDWARNYKTFTGAERGCYFDGARWLAEEYARRLRARADAIRKDSE